MWLNSVCVCKNWHQTLPTWYGKLSAIKQCRGQVFFVGMKLLREEGKIWKISNAREERCFIRESMINTVAIIIKENCRIIVRQLYVLQNISVFTQYNWTIGTEMYLRPMDSKTLDPGANAASSWCVHRMELKTRTRRSQHCAISGYFLSSRNH